MPPPPPSPYGEVSRQLSRNRRRALVAVLSAPAAPALVVAVVLGLLLGWWLAPIVFVVLVLAGAAALWRAASTRPLSLLDARPPAPDSRESARLNNLVDGLCVVAGLPRPRVLVLDDPGLNALVVGVSPESASLVVTSGLVSELSRIEMEGLVAHELSHIRRGDALVGGVASVTVAPLGSLWPSLGGWAAEALIGDREEPADAAAVGLTKFPPALAAALEKMEQGRVAPRHPAVDILWDVAPVGRGPGPSSPWRALVGDKVQERIASLREL